MQFDRQFIQQVLPDSYCVGPEYINLSFCVDSRSIQKGECFVALTGLRVNGHDYIQDAIDRGASALMIDHAHKDILQAINKQVLTTIMVIVVKDTFDALVSLARAWRSLWTIPVIGITGSVGKTSTKEFLAAILTSLGKQCLASTGNQNTVLGLALNILKIRAHHDYAVLEMGISKRGEMSNMAELARPTTAVITMIGHSHMEGLGSLSDIAVEKRDIFKYFKEDNIGIVNGDQALLAHIAYHHPIIKFGTRTSNQIQARKIVINESSISFILKLYKDKYLLELDSCHAARITHILAVAGILEVLGISHDKSVAQLSRTLVVQSRFQKRAIKQSKGLLIDDCYNANPESMKAALEAFERMNSSHKIAVLGDMFELGMNSSFWHRQLGRLLRKSPSIKHVILVGNNIKATLKTMPATITTECVPSWVEAVPALQQHLEADSLVLVKGSRGMKLNELVKEICE